MKIPKPSNEGALSSGRRLGLGITTRRPALAVEGEAQPSQNGSPFVSFILSFIRSITASVVILVILLVSGWLLLGLTALPILSVNGTPWLVKWAAWPEGMVPSASGAVAMVSGSARQTDLGARFSLLVSQDDGRKIVQVVAGPGGEIKAGPDLQIYYNNVPTGAYAVTPFPSTRLGSNYFALCLSGASCESGQYELVPIQNVLGEVVGSVRLGPGLGPVPELLVTPQTFPALPPMPIEVDEATAESLPSAESSESNGKSRK